MSEIAIRPNETTVPLMPCASVEEALAFYEALGFQATYKQSKPYVYLALQWSGFQLHFGPAPEGLDPAREKSGGCLVMVDAVAPYHAAFVAAMRRAHGKVLNSGLPRITRYRPGASRFTLIDPSGNSIIFIQRDEPAELEYGGSKKLKGLAKALDNARILREFKNDDLQAFRALKSAMRRHGADAPAGHRPVPPHRSGHGSRRAHRSMGCRFAWSGAHHQRQAAYRVGTRASPWTSGVASLKRAGATSRSVTRYVVMRWLRKNMQLSTRSPPVEELSPQLELSHTVAILTTAVAQQAAISRD